MRATRLTRRQREILDHLVEKVREKGYAPSVREIGVALGLRSPSTVHQHLTALERKGYVRRHGDRMRALEIIDKSLVHQADALTMPIVGRVSAGYPTLADQNVDDYVQVPPRLFGDVRGCFLLRVRGDSMKGAGILPGDLAMVRPQPQANPGEIVVALLGDDATVKRLAIEEGRPTLFPENPLYMPIRQEFQIIGRVIGLLRAYQEARLWA